MTLFNLMGIIYKEYWLTKTEYFGLPCALKSNVLCFWGFFTHKFPVKLISGLYCEDVRTM